MNPSEYGSQSFGPEPHWICAQLGAREHYAIPRALQRRAALNCLITDVWSRPESSTIGLRPARWRQRYHPAIADAEVCAFDGSAYWFELSQRSLGRKAWNLTILRNQWFQARAVDCLQRRPGPSGKRPCLFSYSYTAKRLFELARSRGWTTVLGQIDPGPFEDRLVRALPGGSDEPEIPTGYWEDWKAECALADHLVVNSHWSKRALEHEGVDGAKISIVPLAYEPPREAQEFQRRYPESFTAVRPLRVLFLGQANRRKGMDIVLKAMDALSGAPVEFWIVGPVSIAIPENLRNQPSIKWIGAVPRQTVDQYFRAADVFLFPTFSDGFGLTQLEAQAWKLPIVASQFCGDVVRHGENGLILDQVTSAELVSSIQRCLDPAQLEAMSRSSGVDPRFTIDALAASLSELSRA